MPSPIVLMIIGSVAGVLVAMWIDKKDLALFGFLVPTGTLPGLAYSVGEPIYGLLSILTLLGAVMWRVRKKKKMVEHSL